MEAQVLSYIQFSKKLVYDSLLATVIGVVSSIVILALVLRFMPSKYQKNFSAKRILFMVISVILILTGMVFFLQSDATRVQRITSLNKDVKNWNLLSGIGTVDNRFAFEKGGCAVLIDGEVYYILPSLGLMDVGSPYGFQYLPSSKFIVSFKEM